MAGHSHWKNIKRKKGALDAKRGKVWSKLSRFIIVAAKTGGGNPDFNVRLRYAIEKAKAANMPNDTIDKAVKKGTGEDSAASYEELLYEGFGPAGVAVLLEILTDNKNRTAPEVRKIFEKNGGNMAGAVAWLFAKRGVISVPPAAGITEESLMELTLDAGAEEISANPEGFEITSEVSAFEAVKKSLEAAKIQFSAELTMIPNQLVSVSGAVAEQVNRLVESLEDHDDIQNVYTNADFADGE